MGELQVSTPFSKLRNIFLGKPFTFTTFDTNPTNPERITDGDWKTQTGAGSKVMAGAGNFGYAKIDLGSVKTILLGGRISIYSTGGTVSVSAYLERSYDDITYKGQSSAISNGATDAEKELTPVVINGRYFQLRFNLNGADTGNVKINQLVGYELG